MFCVIHNNTEMLVIHEGLMKTSNFLGFVDQLHDKLLSHCSNIYAFFPGKCHLTSQYSLSIVKICSTIRRPGSKDPERCLLRTGFSPTSYLNHTNIGAFLEFERKSRKVC